MSFFSDVRNINQCFYFAKQNVKGALKVFLLKQFYKFKSFLNPLDKPFLFTKIEMVFSLKKALLI